MKFSLKSKVWLEKGGRKVFGDGPCDILERVERTGSLRQAASEINMSYSQAWGLIYGLEKKLGLPLLTRQAGGEGGGGSVLTREGKELSRRFSAFRKEMNRAQDELFDKHFGRGDG